MPRANSHAILLLVHGPVNSIRNMVLRCYTDRHSTVIAAKGSTLDDKQGFYFSEHGEAGTARSSSVEAFLRAVESDRMAYVMERKRFLTGGVKEMS